MTSRPATYDHLIGRKKPLTKTVTVILDPELAEDYEAARHQKEVAVARADMAGADDTEAAFRLMEADQAIDTLRRRLHEEEAVVRFKFKGIGRAAFEALVDRHPPTPEQRTKAKSQGWETLAWNPDTFPPAVVAACLVEPALTQVDVERLWADPNWNQAELQVLLNAAIEVNGQRRTVELGKDWPPTPSSGPRSDTA